MALPKPIMLRIILIAVVFFVLLVTLVGHFGSDWNQENKNLRNNPFLQGVRIQKQYKSCDSGSYGIVRYKKGETPKIEVYACSDIGMEHFYVAMLFLCLFGAIGSVLLVVFNKKDNKWLRLVDFVLHVVLGLLLLIGVITFLVSSIQLQVIFDEENELIRKHNEDRPQDKLKEYDEWFQEIIKIIAAILGVAVVALHGFLAFLVGKPLFQEFKKGRGENAEEEAASPSDVQESPSKQGAKEAKSQPSRPEPEGP